jgi:hypothetical protein
MGHRGALARVALCALTTTSCQRCAEADRSALWSSLEGAVRRFAPPDVLAAADQIGATLNLIAGERPPRRAPELLDLLLLRALDKNETSAAALEDEIADVGDARAVRWAWRHASSAYGYAQLKVLGLLPGVFPRSLGDASPERLDAACVRARCGGARLYHGAFKSSKRERNSQLQRLISRPFSTRFG